MKRRVVMMEAARKETMKEFCRLRINGGVKPARRRRATVDVVVDEVVNVDV